MRRCTGKRASRKDALFALWASVFLLWAPSAAADCPHPSVAERATVGYIYDGDTLRLKDGRKVRLIGINTPEVAHDERPAQPLAEAAKQALMELVPPGTAIGLEYGAERHDRHGRMLAHVILDQRNINRLLLSRGLAQAIAIPPNVRWLECYWQAEAGARDEHLGLWRHPYYRSREASGLSGSERGFLRLRGRVTRVGESRKAWWLELDGPAVLRIDKRNRDYFGALDFKALRGHKVEARGWLYPYRAKLRMGVRHGQSLQILD